MALTVIAIMSPNQGCEQRALQLLKEFPDKIKQSEPYTSAYHTFRADASDEGEGLVNYVAIFRYALYSISSFGDCLILSSLPRRFGGEAQPTRHPKKTPQGHYIHVF
jgi:hypothetical protein